MADYTGYQQLLALSREQVIAITRGDFGALRAILSAKSRIIAKLTGPDDPDQIPGPVLAIIESIKDTDRQTRSLLARQSSSAIASVPDQHEERWHRITPEDTPLPQEERN